MTSRQVRVSLRAIIAEYAFRKFDPPLNCLHSFLNEELIDRVLQIFFVALFFLSFINEPPKMKKARRQGQRIPSPLSEYFVNEEEPPLLDILN